LYAEKKGSTMVLLMGAFLATVLLVGTAALSGHPLSLILVAALVGAAILLLTRGPRVISRQRR
jgi:uncharacterized membrane protein YeaQ/YmgE (transglycosylase-associated protein family)